MPKPTIELLQYRLMTNDALIAGAAAPSPTRRVVSAARLDVLWVLAVSAALGVSSLFDLIDLPETRLRTGEAPLRIFVVGVPIIACAIGAVAARRRSEMLAAAATGVLAPGVALAGALSIALFLADESAFADVGVAISLGASLLGIVMIVRWFVYHPLSLLGTEPRPQRPVAIGVSGVGAALAIAVVVAGLDDPVSVAWVASTCAMLVVPVTVMASGVVRTVPAIVLAAAAAAAQVLAVLVAKVEQSDLSFDSDLVLRTGVIGLIGLIVAIVLAVASAVRATPDDESAEIDDDESWRWSTDD